MRGGEGKKKKRKEKRATGSRIDQVENLCLVGSILTQEQICHICLAFSAAKRERNNRMLPHSQGGKEWWWWWGGSKRMQREQKKNPPTPPNRLSVNTFIPDREKQVTVQQHSI